MIIQAKEGGYAHLKMPSGEIRMVSLEAMATVGVLGNEEWKKSLLKGTKVKIEKTATGKVADERSSSLNKAEIAKEETRKQSQKQKSEK